MLDSGLHVMPTRFFVRLLVVLFCLGMPAVGAAGEEPATVPEASEGQLADRKAAADSQDDGEKVAPAADTVADQMGEVSLEEFVPSEEIGADGAVSFPVDI